MLRNTIKIDPRVKRTRQLLQQALTELLSEHTFHNITVQDIAARAEVNRATFYAHFEDKYALLNYTVREMFQQLLARKLPTAPQLTLANLRLLTLTVCEYLGEFVGHCAPSSQNHEQAIMVGEVQVYLFDVIQQWIRNTPHQAFHTPSPEAVALVTSWAIFGSVLQWAWDGRKQSAEQLTQQVMGILTTGLQTHFVVDTHRLQ